MSLTQGRLTESAGMRGLEAGSNRVTEDYITGVFFFDGITPDSDTIYNDGGGSLYTGHHWYRSGAGFTVLGARVWNPPEADSTFLDTDVTLYAYARDSLTGDDMAEPTWGSPTQTKLHSTTRVAGEWTEIWLDTPIAINGFAVGVNNPDTICLAVRWAGGNYYTVLTDTLVATSSPVESVANDNVFFPDHAYRRSVNSLGVPVNFWYGLDLIYELP